MDLSMLFLYLWIALGGFMGSKYAIAQNQNEIWYILLFFCYESILTLHIIFSFDFRNRINWFTLKYQL